MIDGFIKGADVSSLLEVEEAGGRFFDEAGRDGSQPSAALRSDEAGRDGSQPSAALRSDEACRDGSQPSAALRSDEAAGQRSGIRDQGSGAGEKAFPLRGRCPSAHTGADEVASQPSELFEILRRHGVNLIRLRLWNDPYDPNGKPYGAGTNDLPRTVELARRAKAAGLPWLLDFHYSDFWADPGKQYPPKAWAGMDAARLEQAVYDFTYETLSALKREGLLPAMAAPGNELTNGLLWPLGRTPNWANLVRFVSAGIRAIRDAAPQAEIMLHLDNGGNQAMYRDWFGRWFENGGADFDCIGLSYYPFWHGSLEALGANMTELARRWGKPMIVAETSMAFTLEECCAYEGLSRSEKRGLAANEKTAAAVPYPCTPAGQAAFLAELWSVIRSVPGDLGRGFIWWEPAWLPVKGSGWTTEAGLAYVKEQGPGGNEWANQALFDYLGRALPALDTLEKLC